MEGLRKNTRRKVGSRSISAVMTHYVQCGFNLYFPDS